CSVRADRYGFFAFCVVTWAHLRGSLTPCNVQVAFHSPEGVRMTPRSLLSGRRSVSVLAVAASIAAFGSLGLQTAAASKDAPAVPAPPTQPTRADQIQNIDQVKTAIKA